MAWAQPQPGEMNEELTVKPIDEPQHRAEGRGIKKERTGVTSRKIGKWQSTKYGPYRTTPKERIPATSELRSRSLLR